ncbi:MAG: PIN domain nuclease, partial [Defluviitaleaceae bacterium]|nr:PIN domain nuclease [Defluviitaleaceae bacterium]
GARNSKEYNQLNEYLLNMHIYLLPKTIKTYDVAAQLYFNLRRQGITPRSTIDVLIALTAMEYDLFLLHDDKDFDMMAAKMPSLKVYE